MLRRLGYVLLNYATRPMMWALGGIYILFLGGALKESVWKPQAGQSRPLQQAYPSMWGWGRHLIVQNPETVRDFERGRFDHSITSAEMRWPTANRSKESGLVVIPRRPLFKES